MGHSNGGAHNSGNGAAFRWLQKHATYQGDDCLIWPFCRDERGRGHVGYRGSIYRAPTLMCQIVHGATPGSSYQVAHSCGKGHLGCVNPRHLSWKTRSENQLDRRKHGTAVSHRTGWKGKLTLEQREQIVALKGKKTQREIADMFGVSYACIQYWHWQREQRGHVGKFCRTE